mgnify:CR=1 FL=1
MLVILFGPDGSGKTTLAKALAEKLSRHGFKIKVSWMRGTHTLASILAKFLSRFATFRGFDNPYYGISLPDSAKRVWQIIEFISVLPVLLVRFMLPCFSGYVVIAERYVPDFLIWVALTTKDESYLESLEARFLLALMMKADVRVYMTASEAELEKRRGGEVDHEFLSRQIKLYDKVATMLRAYKIDTTEKALKRH